MKIELHEFVNFSFVIDNLKTNENYERIAEQIQMLYHTHCCDYAYTGASLQNDVRGIIEEYPNTHAIGITVYRDNSIIEEWQLYDVIGYSNLVEFNTLYFEDN